MKTGKVKGTAAKSASGASMSKYDVEVEARLNQIEAKLALRSWKIKKFIKVLTIPVNATVMERSYQKIAA